MMPQDHSPTIADTLARLRVQRLDRLDAQLLLLHVLQRGAHDRAWLLAHNNDLIDPQALPHLEALVQRRQRGEPLAYLTGHKEFFGLDLQVDARVLVPRPDTETLVEWALALLQPDADTAPTKAAPPTVLDLGTGSGAIALALKATRPGLRVTAIDDSAEALAVARSNARHLKLDVQFSQGAWFAGLEQPDDRFQVIVSNPPYIAAQDPHLAALTHEPLQALASGSDGLDDIRRIVNDAPAHLQPGGWLLLEHGYDQASRVRGLLLAAGLTQVQSRRDLSGIERCSGGQATTD